MLNGDTRGILNLFLFVWIPTACIETYYYYYWLLYLLNKKNAVRRTSGAWGCWSVVRLVTDDSQPHQTIEQKNVSILHSSPLTARTIGGCDNGLGWNDSANLSKASYLWFTVQVTCEVRSEKQYATCSTAKTFKYLPRFSRFMRS